MRKLLWFFFIGCLAFIFGCDEGSDPGPVPEVIRVSVDNVWELTSAEGWGVPSNASIFVTFSKEMANDTVVISLNGIPVSATPYDDETLTFTLEDEGEFELTITGEDIHGQTLEPPYGPISFTVVGPDVLMPYIVADECEPENGAQEVDTDIEQFIIAFSERMFMVIVNYTFPEFPFAKELSADGKFLTIKFENGYRLSNDMHVNVQLSGKDLVGHLLQPSEEYSFTTVSR